jgi:hypothetical protein
MVILRARGENRSDRAERNLALRVGGKASDDQQAGRGREFHWRRMIWWMANVRVPKSGPEVRDG